VQTLGYESGDGIEGLEARPEKRIEELAVQVSESRRGAVAMASLTASGEAATPTVFPDEKWSPPRWAPLLRGGDNGRPPPPVRNTMVGQTFAGVPS
jgi:hypothetical protein